MTALHGMNMVQLCWMRFTVHVTRRFAGRVYGGMYDGARSEL